MKNLLKILIILTFATFGANSQTEYLQWPITGTTDIIDFRSSEPEFLEASLKGFTQEGQGFICDSTGQLLFYVESEGVEMVLNKYPENIRIDNFLNYANSINQGNYIVRINNDKYVWLLSATTDMSYIGVAAADKIEYIIIEYDNFENQYNLTQKNLIENHYSENMCIVKDEINDSFYLVTFGVKKGNYYLYWFDKNNEEFVLKQTLYSGYINNGHILQIKTTLRGNLVVGCPAGGVFQFLTFDKKNEKLEISHEEINPNMHQYSFEFSPNGNHLYYLDGYEAELHAYTNLKDIENIENVKVDIGFDRDHFFDDKLGSFVMGPNGKIYLFTDNEYLRALNNPNDINDVQFEEKAFYTERGNTNSIHKPLPIKTYYFYVFDIEDKEVCVSDDLLLEFESMNEPDNLEITWEGPGLNSNERSPLIENITLGQSGTYKLKVKFNDFVFNKEFNVKVKAPDYEIASTKDSLCIGDTATVFIDQTYADLRYDTFLWNTGDTNTYTRVDKPGTYYVEVTDFDGCKMSDTLTIESLKPEISIVSSKSTSFCEGDSTVLSVIPYNNDITYQWNTGETGENITVNTTGRYTVIATRTETCKDTASIDIQVDDDITPVIKGETILCGTDESIILTAEPSGTDYEYLWSTGETTQSIEVNQPDTYSVTVTKGICTGFAEREIEQYPEPQFNIEGNTSICVGETTTLSSSEDFEEYLWSTGDITKEIEVDAAGKYSLTVTDENGCTTTEQVTVEVNEVDYDLSANSVDYGKTYITETKSEIITLTNTSGNDIVIDGNTIQTGGNFEIIHTLNPERTGPYTETIEVNITEQCVETITIDVTAEIYARVTVRAPEIETQVGATNVPLPIRMSAEADLDDKEYDYTIETIVNNEIYFSDDNMRYTDISEIESNETEIVSYSGTVLLARQLEYPITFGEVSFSDPYIEIETIDGQITVDRICVHGTRNVLHSFTDITVNPNPAKDNINIGIKTEEEGNISVELISATGASVYTNNLNHSSGSDNIQIQTDEIPSGMYQIIIKTKGHIYRKEIVVAR